jgi:hypothetical protein
VTGRLLTAREVAGRLTLTLDLSPETLDDIAERVAAILAEQKPPTDDGWLRGAEEIAGYIGSTPSRVYTLVSARRIPVERDGAAIVAKRSPAIPEHD